MQQGRRSDDGKPCGNAWSGFGAKEKARRKKCKVRLSRIKNNKAFQKSYMKVEVKKLLRAGMVPARTWRVHVVGMAPTERLKKQMKQMAAAAGKKSTTSLSFFMEASGLEVAEPTLWLLGRAEGAWIGKRHTKQKEAWLNQVFEKLRRGGR